MYCPKPVRFNRLSVKSPKGKYSPSDDSCSTGISDSDEDNGCSARISRKPQKTEVSPTDDKLPPQFQAGDRVHHRKDPNRPGTILSAVSCSTRYRVGWDAGSVSAIEARNLEHDDSPRLSNMGGLNETQNHWLRMLLREPDYKPEKDGQFTIFTEDEPPDPDDFESREDYLAAWVEWEYQYPELAEAIARRETEAIPAEQKIHIPAEQKPQTETVKTPKTRNTKPGRGSRPKQISCNVKRNGNKGKSPNSYWLYQFSFKVDGRYYNRSVSIPKEKVNRVVEMWESKQYSWQDIVEFIGKDSDIIIEKARSKTES